MSSKVQAGTDVSSDVQQSPAKYGCVQRVHCKQQVALLSQVSTAFAGTNTTGRRCELSRWASLHCDGVDVSAVA
ncbi:hypothetical protein HaLaN_18158 [Haematococcus lacustris]|uniref:Uncharacterized protein n=1 Tax=Haematococcus lacustris TaxID=44745 RepID=A0A699ZMV7_HAELA|nr:hypothetical protein HaLaN_18158 [Haematococcus lacustris]